MAVAGQPDQSGITRLLSTINSLMSPGGKTGGGGVRGGQAARSHPMMLFVLSADRRRRAGEPPASDGTFNPTHPAAEASRQRAAHTERGAGEEGRGGERKADKVHRPRGSSGGGGGGDGGGI